MSNVLSLTIPIVFVAATSMVPRALCSRLCFARSPVQNALLPPLRTAQTVHPAPPWSVC